MATHSRLSPSAASRWMACPASVRRSEGLQDTNNTYAIEGTFAHALAAQCLSLGVHPAEFAGQRARDFLSEAEMHAYLTEDYGDEPWAFEFFDSLEVDDDMVEHIAGYCDHVMKMASEEGAILLVEQRYDLSGLLGEGNSGTADAVVIVPHRKYLNVTDLKYGRGKMVMAQGNPQALLYTIGAMTNIVDMLGFEIEDIETTIYQPRKYHIDTAKYTRQDLDAFAVEAATKAIRTEMSDAEVVPGEEQCQYCLAKGQCPEYARAVVEIVSGEPLTDDDFAKVMAEPGELVVMPTELFGPDDFARLLPMLDYIRDWCDAVRTAAVREAEAGYLPPGWKMVQGKMGPRQWTDEGAVEDLIRNSMRIPTQLAYKMTLISPTQAEKNLKPKQYKRLEQFIKRTTGKPSLVPESDKRPAMQIGVADDEFANPQTEKGN